YYGELASEFLDRNNPVQVEKFRQKLMEAYNFGSSGQPQAAAEIAAYRQFELVRPEINAIPFALSAFQQINLSNDELPLIIRPMSRQYFNVYWNAIDGAPRQNQIRHTKEVEQILMRYVSTDRVEYPLYDLQQG